MKKFATKVLSIVLMMLMINTLVLNDLSVVYAAESLDVVHFSDPNMEAAVRDELGRPNGDIYKNDINYFTSLNLSNRNISNIDGIQYFTNLSYLVLNSNAISDLSPLSNLTKLDYLDFTYNKISDISSLSNLTNLSILGLSRNNISDIGPLANLTNLTNLGLLGNQNLSDITPLSNLTKLTSLSLHIIRLVI